MRTKWLHLLLVLALAACGDGGTGPDSIAGRYELRTVNGSNLPYVIQQLGNDRVEILSGDIQLSANGTFTSAFGTRTIQGGATSTTTDTDNGTWTQAGDQMSFRFSDNSVDTGVLTDGQLTILSNGVSFVFRK